MILTPDIPTPASTPNERVLWQAVVLRAVQDICTTNESEEALICKAQAHTWFRNADEDFRTVCSLAGFDPDAVQEAYRGGELGKQSTTAFRLCFAHSGRVGGEQG